MARKIVQFLLKKRSWRLGVSNNGVNKSHLDTESRYVLWFCSLSMRNRLLETRLTYDSIWTPDMDYVSFSLYELLLTCFMSQRENTVWPVCSCHYIGMSIWLDEFYLNIVFFHLEIMTSFFTVRDNLRRIWMVYMNIGLLLSHADYSSERINNHKLDELWSLSQVFLSSRNVFDLDCWFEPKTPRSSFELSTTLCLYQTIANKRFRCQVSKVYN